MTGEKKWRLAVLVVLCAGFVSSFGAEPNVAEPNSSADKLKFEMSDEIATRQRTPQKTSVVATANINENHLSSLSRRMGGSSKDRLRNVILQESEKFKVSEEQQKLLKKHNAVNVYGADDYTPKGYKPMRIHAVSTEEARKVTNALVRGVRGEIAKAIEKKRKEIKDIEPQIAESKQSIKESKAKLEKTKAEYEKFKKDNPGVKYRADEDAEEAIKMYTAIIRPARIELASLGGKIDAIKECQKKADYTVEMANRLEEMLIEIGIETAGLFAKVKAAEKQRTLAMSWVEYNDEIQKLPNKIAGEERYIRNSNDWLVRRHVELSELEALITEAVFYNNKVEIQQVKG